ncbi:MAG: UvrB/UvrC motif-containing protein [Bacteroidaceae bacterium]|nr:UvrB/UvrC motif-containing protein [Bacteroidaceae bacterium]
MPQPIFLLSTGSRGLQDRISCRRACHPSTRNCVYIFSPFQPRPEASTSHQHEQRAYVVEQPQIPMAADPIVESMTPKQLRKSIENTRRLMQEAAKRLDFLEAAQYRDEILRLTSLLDEKEESDS